MTASLTSKCFPPSKQCFNCKRKGHDLITGKASSYKRCTGCHFATYCDQDCQKEHWEKIHKFHCKIIAGRKLPDKWKHNDKTCALCTDSREVRMKEISSIDSPKILCYVENVIRCMKRTFGKKLEYHEECRTCECSTSEISLPFELPFSIGEISGQYLGNGVDEMIAHAIKIVCAIQMKDTRSEVTAQTKLLYSVLVISRAIRFVDFIIYGKDVRAFIHEYEDESIAGPVNKLKSFLGPNSSWWRALKFTLEGCVNISMIQKNVKMVDLSGRGLNDKRFLNLKKFWEYSQAQTNNLVITLKNNLFPRFKSWPKIENEALTLLVPDSVFCPACGENQRGPFYFFDEEVEANKASYPVWRPGFGEEGSCLVYCSPLKNPSCVSQCSFRGTMDSIGIQGQTFYQELDLFLTESRICDFCLKRSLFSHRCTDCLASQYCSTQCQKNDLWFHKTVCSRWAKDEKRKIDSRKKQREFWKSCYEAENV